MTTYTIDAKNNITALGSQQADFEGEIFASQQELWGSRRQMAADRLVEVYNGIPGLTPVKKLTNRKSAVGRIWNRPSLSNTNMIAASLGIHRRPRCSSLPRLWPLRN